MSFNLEIAGFVNRTLAHQNVVVRKVVLDIDRAVVKKSPVDTGRFKGNWQLGIGTAPSGELDVYDKDGRDTLALHRSQMPQEAAGKVYYLVNNLDYAQALEDGWSSQSPPGNMVAGTVADYQAIIEQAVRG